MLTRVSLKKVTKQLLELAKQTRNAMNRTAATAQSLSNLHLKSTSVLAFRQTPQCPSCCLIHLQSTSWIHISQALSKPTQLSPTCLSRGNESALKAGARLQH